MTAAVFLQQLEANLSALPAEERENALVYYREYFEEAGPENEDAAAERLGSPQSVAERIIREVGTASTAAQYNVPPLAEKPAVLKDDSHLLLGIILIIVTFPIWIAVLSIVLSIIASIVVVILSFAAAGIGAPIQGVFTAIGGELWFGMFEIGGGLFCLGMAMLLWKPAYLLTKWMVMLCITGAGYFFRWMSGKGAKV